MRRLPPHTPDMLRAILHDPLDEGLVFRTSNDPNLAGGKYWYDDSPYGKGNHGTLTNGPVWVAGRNGNALSFDGTNDLVDCGNDLFQSHSIGTVSAWIRLSSAPSGFSGAVFSAASDSSDDYFWQFTVISSSLKIGASHQIAGASTQVVAGTALTIGRWYHVAITSNGSTYIIYIDGVSQSLEVDAGSNAGQWFDDTTFGVDSYSIGAMRRSSGDINRFPGLIESVQVYNRALSAAEVTELFQRTGPPRDAWVGCGVFVNEVFRPFRRRRGLHMGRDGVLQKM